MHKPQVILRLEGIDDNKMPVIQLIKKWHDNTLSIEQHTLEAAKNHNINVPDYFFPIDIEYARELFKKAGKEYRG